MSECLNGVALKLGAFSLIVVMVILVTTENACNLPLTVMLGWQTIPHMARSKVVTNIKQPGVSEKPRGGRGIKSPDPRKIVTTGIKQSEFDELKSVAEANGVAPNSVIAFFLRYSLQQYREGKLKIPTFTTRKIQMP